MTILHVAPFLQGGAGRAIVDLAIAQHRDGDDVVVFASNTGAPGYGNYAGHLASLEAAHVPVRLVDSLFRRDPAATLVAAEAILEIIDGIGVPDIIHSHASVPGFAALVVAGALRKPIGLVQTMHGWGLVKTVTQAAADVRVMNLMDRVVVPSETSRRRMVGFGVDQARLSVVPYGVAPDAPTPLTDAEAALVAEIASCRREGGAVLACIGTIGERKNQACLVDALAFIETERRVLVVFVGDGDASGLQAQVERAGRGGDVRVHGYTPAARHMATGADILVLPSRSEEQPLAILEAFCDETLVVASDIPEIAELVTDGDTGVLAKSDDPAALGAALDRAMRLSAADRSAIVARAAGLHRELFTLPLMVERYRDEYYDVLPQTARPRLPTPYPLRATIAERRG